MTRGRTLLAVVVVAAAAGFGIATLLGAFDDETAQARAAAERYATALTDGSSRSLAAVACSKPSRAQAAAFDARAGESGMRWSVLDTPRIDGETAHATLRAEHGDQHRDYPITLHRRDGAWCANYNWSRLRTPR